MALQDNRLSWQDDIARLEEEIEQLQLGEIPELDAIGDRVTTLEGQVVSISGELAQEIQDRTDEVAALQNSLSAVSNSLNQEILDRQSSDNAIGLEIDAVESSIAQEILDRQAADTSLNNEIVRVESDFAVDVQDLQAALAQEILDRQTAVAQEIDDRQDADTAIGLEIDAVQASVAQEILDRQAADAAIGLDIDAVESSIAQEIINRQAADAAIGLEIDAVELALAQEAASRELEDAQTLADAQGYADSLHAAQGLEIDAVEASIAQEILDRQSGDAALSSRVNVLETFGYDQVVYVSKNGLDTNSGKQHSPFLTITAALNSITDASPSKRYALMLMPGSYTEASLALKANVFIMGQGQKEAIRVTGALSMGSSFTANSSFDHRSGASNVTFLSAANFDWNAVQSAAGKLYFNEVVFGSTLSMNGWNNAIAQAQFNSCVIFSTFTVSGINIGTFTNTICFGNINLNQHPNGGMATILSATGGYCGGTVKLATTVNDFGRRCSAFLRSFWCENLTSDGPSSYADVDLTSGSKQGAQTLNGGQVIALNPVISHDLATQMIVPRNTNSHNMGDWGKQWSWNFGYVHASTGTDLFLISYPSSYAPDSAGKSIGIYTDGAGLQENANGGEITLETSATSGTGVRGKIILNGREIDVTSKQIKNLADGTLPNDAVNKAQLDLVSGGSSSAIEAEEAARIAADANLQSQITTEKNRVDAILSASEADKDSFAEIVALINSVDLENDQAFAAYALSNDARVLEVENDLAQEILDRQAADALIQNSVQDIADELADLEGLESDVRADLDDLEAFSYNTQAELDQEVLDRQSADTLLDGRLDIVEPKVTTLESEMDAAQLDLVSLDGRLDVVEPKVTTLESEMDAAQSSISTLQSDVAAIEDSVGQAGGLVPLNGSGLIDSQFLPSYVDDVLEFANLAGFPAIGETAKIYVALDNGKCYRWSGSQYIEISASEVNSVNTKTGVVVLNASDILMVSEVKSIEQKLVDLQGETTSLDGRLDSAELNITDLGEDITDLQSQIDDLEASSGGNTTELDALTLRVEALEAEGHFVAHSMQVPIVSSAEQVSITLDHLAVISTLDIHVDAMKAHYIRDFSVSEVAGKTVVTWTNTFAIGGIEAVAIGETAYISYSYEV